jgi:hypothetical protein
MALSLCKLLWDKEIDELLWNYGYFLYLFIIYLIPKSLWDKEINYFNYFNYGDNYDSGKKRATVVVVARYIERKWLFGDDGDDVFVVVTEETDVGGLCEEDALSRRGYDGVTGRDVGDVRTDLEDDGVARFLSVGCRVVGNVEGAVGTDERDVGDKVVRKRGYGVVGGGKRREYGVYGGHIGLL